MMGMMMGMMAVMLAMLSCAAVGVCVYVASTGVSATLSDARSMLNCYTALPAPSPPSILFGLPAPDLRAISSCVGASDMRQASPSGRDAPAPLDAPWMRGIVGLLLTFVCCVAAAFAPVRDGLLTLLASLGSGAAWSLRKVARQPLFPLFGLAPLALILVVGLARASGAPS